MTTHFKNLYRQYIEQGIPSPDFGEFKKELSNMPDEELWNTMIDMDKDTTTEKKITSTKLIIEIKKNRNKNRRF